MPPETLPPLVVGPLDPVPPPPVGGNWNLIFRDEFAGNGLDPVWHTAQYWDSDYTIVGGGELQVYDATAVSVSGGDAAPDRAGGNEIRRCLTSAAWCRPAATTASPDEPRFSFLFGYMEVRAKLPAGQGMWPAIWMMPASYHDGNGELDVLEVIGSEPTVANFSLHRNGRDETDDWDGPDFSRKFHTFGVDWQADHVSWYVDGIERARMTDPRPDLPRGDVPDPERRRRRRLARDRRTTRHVFPATMEVDFVRVWQQAAPAQVVGRHVFYNRSAADGHDAAANEADDLAVAADKAALLPGETASFDNLTGYSRGINGVMIDVLGLPTSTALRLRRRVRLQDGHHGRPRRRGTTRRPRRP